MAQATHNKINWHNINFKEDEASTQGTHALQFMVEKLHEAQHNPSLRPMVQGLMLAHDMVLTTKSPPRELDSPQGSEHVQGPLEQEEKMVTNAPQERRCNDLPSQATKRRRSTSSSDSSSSKSGRSERGCFHQ